MSTVGAFGTAIIFMFAALGASLFLLYFLAYLGHCLLVTLNATAAGADEVSWPDEPIWDWVWRSVFLGWLVAIWLMPLAIAAGITAGVLRLDFATFCVVLAGLFWLVWPVSLLSCLSGQSWMQLLNGPVVLGLLRRWPATLWMYLATGALTAGAAWLGTVAMRAQEGWPWYVVLAAPVLAAVLLIDARLLGRVAWLIGQKPLEEARRRGRRERNRPVKVRAVDPWAVEEPALEVQLEPLADAPAAATAEPEDEWAPPTAYGLDAPAGPKPIRPSYERPRPPGRREGYDVVEERGPRTTPPTPLDGSRPVGETWPSPRGRRTPPEPPLPPRTPPSRLRWPLVHGVFTFPWYPGSLSAWGYLTALAFLHLLLLKTMLIWYPY